MAAVTICSDFGAPQNEVSHCVSIVSPSICHEVLGPDGMILVFWMLSFQPTFSLSSTYSELFIILNLTVGNNYHSIFSSKVWDFWVSQPIKCVI